MSIPQLRVRTEFSFRNAFGTTARVAEALASLETPSAAIVDAGTWGHVRFAKAARARGVRPMFGTELTVPNEAGMKPVAWALAEDTRAFYRFSTAARQKDADIAALFRETSKGVLRFAGAALTDPESFDYIDLNPASPLVQRASLRLAKQTGKPLVLTSDNYYPLKSDYAAFMAIVGRERVTPQHLLSLEEMRAAFRILDDAEFKLAVANTFEVAERAASELPTAPIIHVDGDLRELAEKGKARRLALGHLPAWPREYEDRLQRELREIEAKAFESYFIVVADLVNWAKERMLVGPGRGSSAGSLLCYLLGITEVDPIPHGLLFERFIDVTRKDLPDIDIDFSDAKRDECFDYLAAKYGRDNVARIGNVNTLKPRSAIAEVCKRFGIPDHERFDLLNVLIEHSSGSSLYGKSLEQAINETDTGRKFMQRNPKAVIMSEVENHAWHTGVHAAGVIVCNVPVNEFCTVSADGVAQIDKPDSEALNLLKIDALGLRTLGLIEDSGVVTAEELYALKLDDPEVFGVLNDRKFSGVFQFEGQAQRLVSSNIHIDSFQKIDHITALARPGPLGGGASQHYINRSEGSEPVTYRHPSMEEYLGSTLGIVLYQEQVMRICFEIGKFSWEVVAEIRKAMSASKGVEYFNRRGAEFIAGAATLGIPKADAETIWAEICTFGAWGMNKSHTCAYSVISYWCAWMKRYYPLEYAAACLRNAKDDDQTLEILREMRDEGIDYTPFDIDASDVNWSVQGGRLVGGFMNLNGYGPAKSVAAVEARRLGKLNREKVLEAHVKFTDLFPLRTRFAAMYDDPEAFGCREGSVIATVDTFPEEGDVLWIAAITDKKSRDMNESVLIKKRDGKVIKDPTAFVDFRLRDDTGIPIIGRIDRYDFEPMGRLALERLRPNEDFVLVRGKRIKGFSMIKIKKIKCLNRPEALDA